MWASIQIVLELKRQAEVEDGLAYTWVLLLRHDIAWQARLVFSELNPTLLYLANACFIERTATGRCRALTSSPTPAVDYYFAGASFLMDRIFLDVTRDLEHFCFYASRASSSNHKVVDGRLEKLGLWPRVGRHLYHAIDVELLRDYYIDHMLSCALSQGGWSVDPDQRSAQIVNGTWTSPLQHTHTSGHSRLWLGNVTSMWKVQDSIVAASDAPIESRAVIGQPTQRASRCPSSITPCGCSAHQAGRAWRHIEPLLLPPKKPTPPPRNATSSPPKVAARPPMVRESGMGIAPANHSHREGQSRNVGRL
jgi:hypothetical protein